jgi:uncharacterized protein
VLIIKDENSIPTEPTIEYPTRWGFKIIGRSSEELHACIKEVMGEKEHLCSYGNTTSKGNYHSYNASCVVESKEERDRIFQCFAEHDHVKMVI